MNDFDLAAKNIGNRFALVLVASERMREIHRKRREQEDLGLLSVEQRKRQQKPCDQAIGDIETKLVGIEYLNKIKSRERKRKPKFDPI